MSEATITLYRPTGLKELALVEKSGFKRWPPRLPDQPIFYPVTNEDYARQIARDWNVKDSGAGYVTRFYVKADSWRSMRRRKSAVKVTRNGGFRRKIWNS